jgi:hypothetical protein
MNFHVVSFMSWMDNYIFLRFGLSLASNKASSVFLFVMEIFRYVLFCLKVHIMSWLIFKLITFKYIY